MKFTEQWQVYALASAFFAGLTALFGKIGVTGINSNLATLIRTVVIFAVTALIISFRKEWANPSTISRHTFLFLLLSGIATGLSWLCYYKALQLGPASRVAPVDKLSVVFAVLLALFFLGEKLSVGAALGVFLIALGSVVMAVA